MMLLHRTTDQRRALRLPGGMMMPLGNLGTGLGLAAVSLVLAAFSIGAGETAVGFRDLVGVLVGHDLTDAQAFALLDVRLPRVLVGFMAGWCVALTGAMLQSLAQNPLADPGLLGLSQGSMVTIMAMLVFWPVAPVAFTPVAAVMGGLAVAGLLSVLVGKARAGGLAILLMGIAIDTVLSAVTSILILYAPSETSYALSNWLAGSLFKASWDTLEGLAPWFVLSLPALFWAGRSLRALDLGDDLAISLGEPVARSQPVILILAVFLTSMAVTAVGPLVFLGVMAPHLATFISPATGRARLLLSGLTGGALVIAADWLTRTATTDLALPIGLSLTLVGVPLFVITLRLRALRLLSGD